MKNTAQPHHFIIITQPEAHLWCWKSLQKKLWVKTDLLLGESVKLVMAW